MKTNGMEEELDDLLAEGVAAATEREKTEFDRLAEPFAGSIVLFGAAKMGKKALAGLRKAGIEPLAFSDNDPGAWGRSIDGIPVVSPFDAARRYGGSAVFVIAIWGRGSADPMRARERKLRELGCTRVTSFGPLFWKYPEIFLPDLPALDLPHKVHEQAAAVRRGFAALTDDRSRREFLAQLRWRLRFDFDALPDPVSEPIYFPGDIVDVRRDEVYVDCGAFDGDTILEFLRRCHNQCRAIIAFEPDPASWERLRKTVAALPDHVRNRIRIVAAAAGSRRGTIRFSAAGALGSAVGAGETEVACVKLDDALAGDAPTYVKMDIEASEPDALQGASGLIGRYAPVLAVCAYHAQDHLWRIPGTIRSLNPDYGIFLRPHARLVEDLVCYAVPPHRRVAG
jgi:FkbM family methyltransferase